MRPCWQSRVHGLLASTSLPLPVRSNNIIMKGETAHCHAAQAAFLAAAAASPLRLPLPCHVLRHQGRLIVDWSHHTAASACSSQATPLRRPPQPAPVARLVHRHTRVDDRALWQGLDLHREEA